MSLGFKIAAGLMAWGLVLAASPARAGDCHAIVSAALAASSPLKREDRLMQAARLCPGSAEPFRALSDHYLALAAGIVCPYRAQALLRRAARALSRAREKDPDPALAKEYRALAAREKELGARSGEAPMAAIAIARHLAPGRSSRPPRLAPLALPRVEFPNVRFSAGTSRLEPSSLKQLDEIGRCLRFLLPRLKVLVAGHTDRMGQAAGNRELSLSRARQVKAYLVSRWHIDPGRLATAGMGFTQPLAGLSPYDPLNRRVEIRALP